MVNAELPQDGEARKPLSAQVNDYQGRYVIRGLPNSGFSSSGSGSSSSPHVTQEKENQKENQKEKHSQKAEAHLTSPLNDLSEQQRHVGLNTNHTPVELSGENNRTIVGEDDGQVLAPRTETLSEKDQTARPISAEGGRSNSKQVATPKQPARHEKKDPLHVTLDDSSEEFDHASGEGTIGQTEGASEIDLDEYDSLNEHWPKNLAKQKQLSEKARNEQTQLLSGNEIIEMGIEQDPPTGACLSLLTCIPQNKVDPNDFESFIYSLLNIVGTRVLSVGLTTFTRELMRGYIKGTPLFLGAMAITSLMYPIGLNALGLGLSLRARNRVEQALKDFCIALEWSIRGQGLHDENVINDEDIQQQINDFKVRQEESIERCHQLSLDNDALWTTYPQLRVWVSKAETDLKNTLNSERVYLGTKAMNWIRAGNVVSITGLLGAAAGALGRLPALGPTLLAFVVWYCGSRELIQLFLPLKDNVVHEDEKDVPYFDKSATALSSLNYFGTETLVNMGMEYARGMPEYSTVEVVNTLGQCAALGGINAAGEIHDQNTLYVTHKLRAGGDPLQVKAGCRLLREDWPTKDELMATALGIGSERPAAFARVLVASEIVDFLFDPSTWLMAVLSAGWLMFEYPFLIIMATGILFRFGLGTR